ncbi:MAG TPA: bifunctional transaldolase/phosoglucose isomerase [Anaerolineae bacterium]|nr:bifunctional transaldolase/phosoglucose isomerase [Anaerolineae bacterium]
MINKIQQLAQLGQSIWYDNIQRKMITSGKLKAMTDEGLLGMTSNPTIFEKAIAGSGDYDDSIRQLIGAGKNTVEIYDALTIEDVGLAADVFRPVFERTKGGDGYVSIEVLPKLAHDTAATLADVRRLWKTLKRPNVMVKIPATKEGMPAIEQALTEGVNINITLMFSMEHYEAVAEAYLSALERRVQAGKKIAGIASVASFFVSRVDTLVDAKLAELANQGKREATALLGRAAVANSQLVYERFQQIFTSDRFKKLQAKGAKVQRVLWASTSTKNPKYPDTIYVNTLIGPDTINTVPPETYEAIKDHATIQRTVDADFASARKVVNNLEALGLHLHEVGEQLSVEGVDKFSKSFDQLLTVIDDKRLRLMAADVKVGAAELGSYQTQIDQRLAVFDQAALAKRVWAKDASVWSTAPEHVAEITNRLGWLTVIDAMKAQVADLHAFANEIRSAGFTDTVVLGMGGSSLGPDVARITFGAAKGYLKLHVLDTTNPDSIAALEKQINLHTTLFIASSKSGSTIEVEPLHRYFRSKLRPKLGAAYGQNFVAITDPGSPLVALAREEKFRRVFVNQADIGGRYSVLSYFGLVPMALSGIDIERLLDRAQAMARACGPAVASAANPGVWLGSIMGELAQAGRDKITFILSEQIASFGYWVEQLIAESTGKSGKGIVPIEGEAVGAAKVYGDDRLFVYLRLKDDRSLEAKVKALAKAGQPVVYLTLNDVYDLGAEFFRWEMATVVSGAVLQVDPLDQPNVTESKNNTSALLKEYISSGTLPDDDRVEASNSSSLREALAALTKQVKPGDYVALMAYLPMTPANNRALQTLRITVRDGLKVATTIGYGPRFLHSTGQLHKGGANKGVFIQFTADAAKDLKIEGKQFSFGTLIRAQALGDLQALRHRNYRAVRIHLGQEAVSGLRLVRKAIEQAVEPGKRAPKRSAKRTTAKKSIRRSPEKSKR